MLFDAKFRKFQCLGIELTVMLIRSQDGDVLIQATAVLIRYEEVRNIYYLCACSSEGEFDVGIFDTKSEAQTILKDAQNHLESSKTNFVYQVPYKI